VKLGIFCTLDHHAETGSSPRDAYRGAVAEAELAERVGLESFWIAEHHFSAYGIAPDPAVLLAAIAARTRRLRLGTATAVLPFDHPLRAAETYALLDQLSGGRLEFGAGSGYLDYEFAGFGIDASERRARFDEALAIIRRAWGGGPIRHAGPLWRIDAPPLNVAPLQVGGPPIHIAVTRPEAAPFVGRQGLRIATVPYIRMRSLQDLADTLAAYRAALPAGTPGEATVAVHAFCAQAADDADLAAAEAALDRYLRTRVVPGARYAGGPISRDFVLFGDAQAVAAGLRRLEAAGADRVLLITTFGGLAARAAAASLQRLARAVREA
jgi:alkanesulfonate monooxygenase SsuD/methylene tetrahydromethanopterin reductase-like flavin-dependent oxidoreductase (luciferase family)